MEDKVEVIQKTPSPTPQSRETTNIKDSTSNNKEETRSQANSVTLSKHENTHLTIKSLENNEKQTESSKSLETPVVTHDSPEEKRTTPSNDDIPKNMLEKEAPPTKEEPNNKLEKESKPSNEAPKNIDKGGRQPGFTAQSRLYQIPNRLKRSAKKKEMKVYPNIWLPHSHEVRNINTRTK